MIWNLMREMDSLKRDLDRFFGEGDYPKPRIAFLPGRAARSYPLINLSEDADNLYVEALAPAVAVDSLNVSVAGNTLTISGEKPPVSGSIESKAFHRCERSAGKFVRSVELPVSIDEAKISAQYKNGILQITLPKTAEEKPKQIKIAVS